MNAQELRIGNKVEGNGEIVEVDTIGEYGINIGLSGGDSGTCIDYEFRFDEITGIPLTAEWLLKSGGKQEEYYRGIVIEIKLLSGREARLIFQNSGNVILHDGRKNIVIGKIPFVHQLQNLHYALTNSELTIKETVK